MRAKSEKTKNKTKNNVNSSPIPLSLCSVSTICGLQAESLFPYSHHLSHALTCLMAKSLWTPVAKTRWNWDTIPPNNDKLSRWQIEATVRSAIQSNLASEKVGLSHDKSEIGIKGIFSIAQDMYTEMTFVSSEIDWQEVYIWKKKEIQPSNISNSFNFSMCYCSCIWNIQASATRSNKCGSVYVVSDQA